MALCTGMFSHLKIFAFSSQQNDGNNNKNMVFVELYVLCEIMI